MNFSFFCGECYVNGCVVVFFLFLFFFSLGLRTDAVDGNKKLSS